MTQSATIDIEGVGPVLLERSAKAKNLNITVKPFKGIRVAVPKGLEFKKAEQIARGKTSWIKKQQEKMWKLEEEYETTPEIHIDREKAKQVLESRLEEIAAKHGYRYNRLTIRNQKTRWGSCSSKNNISLNMKLVLLPDELRDFILLHELVHTKIKNHGNEFWDEITKVEPKAREYTKQINKLNLILFVA
jgi:predicted metal-dependent hydrolase